MRHPLIAAARNNHPEVCELLLQQAIPKLLVQWAVDNAARYGRLALLQVLIHEGPEGVIEPGRYNPLFAAAWHGHKQVVKLLLSLGADVYDTRGTGWKGTGQHPSCLVGAAISGNPELVQLLLDAGMSLQREWQSVLEVVASTGNLGVAHVLITSAHASLTQQQQQQQQQLQEDSQMQPQDCQFQHLPEQRGCITSKEQHLPGWAELGNALSSASTEGRMGMVQLLLSSGMNISQAALNEALRWAARNGHLDVVQLLLQNKADVNAGCGLFSTAGPLGNAFEGRKWAVADFLIVRGAHTGFAALMHAIVYYAPAHTVRLLLSHGASDTNDRALFTAAQAGQRQTVKVLLGTCKHSTTNGRSKAGAVEAAVCGAASQARLELLQSLLKGLNNPGGAIHRHILNRGLEAAISGQNFEWGPCLPISGSAHSQEEAVAFLLQQGADPDYADGKLLLLAAQQQQGAMLEQLLGAGAAKLDTALVAAYMCGDGLSVAKLLGASKGPVDQAGAALLPTSQEEACQGSCNAPAQGC
jgi:ankyrin repeat protein